MYLPRHVRYFNLACFHVYQYAMMTLSSTEIINKKVDSYLTSMTNLAETITSSSSKEGQEFPFVSVPRFELLGSHIRSIVINDVSIWAPLVTEDQREQWSNFSTTAIGWYNESLSLHYDEPGALTDIYVDDDFRDKIWEGPDLNDTSNVAATTPGPFAPLWQISPPTLSISSVNYNLLHQKIVRDIFPALIEANDCVLGAATIDSGGLPEAIFNSEHTLSDLTSHHPHTIQLTPVSDKKDNKSSIVGFILSMIDWDDIFIGVFPIGTNGILVVIRDTCNQSITYEVNNGEVCYVKCIRLATSRRIFFLHIHYYCWTGGVCDDGGST